MDSSGPMINYDTSARPNVRPSLQAPNGFAINRIRETVLALLALKCEVQHARTPADMPMGDHWSERLCQGEAITCSLIPAPKSTALHRFR